MLYQPLKSADDQYIGNMKYKIKNLDETKKNQEDRTSCFTLSGYIMEHAAILIYP